MSMTLATFRPYPAISPIILCLAILRHTCEFVIRPNIIKQRFTRNGGTEARAKQEGPRHFAMQRVTFFRGRCQTVAKHDGNEALNS